MIDLWQRVRALSARDRRLLGEAAYLLVTMTIGVRMRSYAGVRRLAARLARRPRREGVTAARAAWAIVAVADRLPWHTTCLVRALAGYTLCLRHGWPTDLRIGVLPHKVSDPSPLRSHAWLVRDGEVLIGGVENLDDYAVMVTTDSQ